MTPYQPPPPAPARLQVVFAREAAVGVILRKGPSSWVQMIKWRTYTDQFEAGQWMKARVYENKCDLSPDGKLFVYFVLKGDGASKHPDYGMTWTAISKPPYFTALALWPEHGTWGGGGHFLDNKTVRINVLKDSYHRDHPPRGITVLDMNSSKGQYAEEPLQQEQWKMVSRGHNVRVEYEALLASLTKDTAEGQPVDMDRYQYLNAQMADKKMNNWLTKFDPPAISRKSYTNYSLEQHYFGYRSGRGEVTNLFVVNNATDEKISLENATWADFDQQGRLVLAKEGKLFSATLHKTDLHLTELADFNAHKPEQIVAPDWAQKW